MSELLQKQQTFLQNVAELILWCYEQGYELSAGELYRSQQQQDIYLKEGKSKVAHSKHQDRLAIDLNLFVNDVYMTTGEVFKPLADYWKSLNVNNRAGYDFSFHDNNHFEMQ
jgi:hypothetical protein